MHFQEKGTDLVEQFVTLFDSNYLSRGIALYNSLTVHADKFNLWIICMDKAVMEKLATLNFPNVITLYYLDVLPSELLALEKERTAGEFCWTVTPFTFDVVFNQSPEISRVTYLDADLFFLDSPSRIFHEFYESNRNVLITEHAFAPKYDQSASSGKFCVQFLTMTRGGNAALKEKWKTQCLEWCYARVEEGKFGDQKYLDRWPIDFENIVHIPRDNSCFQGPWNATRFPYSSAITYHFHGFKLVGRKGKYKCGGYEIPEPHLRNVYQKYADELNKIERLLAIRTL